MKKYSLLFLLAACTTLASAQEVITKAHASNYKNWAFGANLVDFYMAGDHSSYDADNGFDFNLGLELHATKYLNSAFGIKANLGFAITPIKGSNGSSSFEASPYIDYSVLAMGNLSALGLRGRAFDRKNAFIVGAGFGLSHSQAESFINEANPQQWPSASSSSTYTTESFIIIESTYKWMINPTWDFNVGLGGRLFFGDPVDALVGTKATNRSDILITPHVGVTYNFGKDKEEEVSVIYTNPLDEMYSQIEEVKNNFDKLTTDDDKDGVNNYFDQDSNTPEGVIVDGSGKASDVDQDGIPDYMDEDPFTSKGAKVNATGRALDSDNDGVADHMDKEPNTPSGTLVNFKGQTLPSGGGASGSVGGYLPSVYFGFNSATVTAANQERLATIALTMKNNSNLKVTILGHADSRGSEEYNKNLSMRRAQAVIKKLVQVYGIAEGRLTAQSSGETTPLAKGNYSVNRRADVVVK